MRDWIRGQVLKVENAAKVALRRVNDAWNLQTARSANAFRESCLSAKKGAYGIDIHKFGQVSDLTVLNFTG